MNWCVFYPFEARMCVFVCKRQRGKREKGGEKPTNVNFPPVMSKMIKMTDILLLINLRRTVRRRENKRKKARKQKLIDHMHLS